MLQKMVGLGIEVLVSMIAFSVHCCLCAAMFLDVDFVIQEWNAPFYFWFIGELDVGVNAVYVSCKFRYELFLDQHKYIVHC